MLLLVAIAEAASTTDKYPSGELRAVTMFVDEANEEKAIRRAVAEMAELGWEHLDFRRMGAIQAESLTGENQDQAIVAAYERACHGGFALIVHEDAVVD